MITFIQAISSAMARVCFTLLPLPRLLVSCPASNHFNRPKQVLLYRAKLSSFCPDLIAHGGDESRAPHHFDPRGSSSSPRLLQGGCVPTSHFNKMKDTDQ